MWERVDSTLVTPDPHVQALSNMTEAIGPEPSRRPHAAAWFLRNGTTIAAHKSLSLSLSPTKPQQTIPPPPHSDHNSAMHWQDSTCRFVAKYALPLRVKVQGYPDLLANIAPNGKREKLLISAEAKKEGRAVGGLIKPKKIKNLKK